MKRRMLDPIGLSPDDGRGVKTVIGRKRSMAEEPRIRFGDHDHASRPGRIGYYLRKGNWNGRQLLSEYIRTATHHGLPSPWPYYAFYWGSNARGSIPDMPNDCFGLGLGDSFVLVCPSLDIVFVRLGTGSAKSQSFPATTIGASGSPVSSATSYVPWRQRRAVKRHEKVGRDPDREFSKGE